MNARLVAMILWPGLALAGAAAADEPGWFLESPAAAGHAELGVDLLAPQFGEQKSSPLSLSAGYRFSESFSLRAQIREIVFNPSHNQPCSETDFACAAGRHSSLDFSAGYALSLMPAFLLHSDLAVYGRLGIQGWNVEANGDPSVNKSDLLFGIGMGYDVSNPLRLQLEYRSMDLDIKLTSIGFSWRF